MLGIFIRKLVKALYIIYLCGKFLLEIVCLLILIHGGMMFDFQAIHPRCL
jgi:hypothetical protein